MQMMGPRGLTAHAGPGDLCQMQAAAKCYAQEGLAPFGLAGWPKALAQMDDEGHTVVYDSFLKVHSCPKSGRSGFGVYK